MKWALAILTATAVLACQPVNRVPGGEPLNAERLLPPLQEALGLEGAEIEILDFSRNQVAPGKLEFQRSALTSSGLWRGRAADSDGCSTPVWVRVRVRDSVTRMVVPLPLGTTPREVERGDKVQVEVLTGGVVLAFDAFAETSGRAGEGVLVKNPENGRLFRARVDFKGKVSVKK